MNGSKCNKIMKVVTLRQIARKWRKVVSARKAAVAFLVSKISFRRRRFRYVNSKRRSLSGVPTDVPAGHLAVYVGERCTRYVIRATYLNHPVFLELLQRAEEEFGYDYEGGISIPCDEVLFEHILRLFSRNSPPLNLENLQNSCLDINNDNEWRCFCEGKGLHEKDTRPLLSVS